MVHGMRIPVVYEDGVISGEQGEDREGQTYYSYHGIVGRDGKWIIIDGKFVMVSIEGYRVVWQMTIRIEGLPPAAGDTASEDDKIPVLTDPEQGEEAAPGSQEGISDDYSDFPHLTPVPGTDSWTWDWGYHDPCDCEKPWEKHAGPVATVLIGIISAIAAALGGAAGGVAGSVGGALGAALESCIAGGGGADSAFGEGEPSPEEEGEGRDPGGDDYLPPPEAGFGGPDDNPFTNHQSGAGPGDCVRNGLPRYFINTASLNLVVRDTVFTSGGLGPEIDLTLTYNSASSDGGIFGPGWSFAYDWLVEQKGNLVSIHKGSGQVLTFIVTGEGSSTHPAEAQPPVGIFHRLLHYGAYWLYIEKESPVYYRFDRVTGMDLARLTAIGDYYGNAVNLGYSREGNLETVTDAAGRLIRFTFGEHHLCSSFALPDGRRASFSYDGRGYLIHTEDLMGIPVDYEYNGDGTLVKMVTGKSKRTVSFSYRSTGTEKLLQSFTDPRGNTTCYNLLSRSPRRVEAIDPEGNRAIFQSRAGLTEQVIDPLGRAVVFEYEKGLPVSCRDRNGGLTRWEYDGSGRLVKEIDPCGQAISFAYDHSGNLQQIANPLGGSWQYSYNDKNSLVGIISPAGRKITIDYNERGLPRGLTGLGGQKISHDYDRYGNIVAASRAGGGRTVIGYDQQGYMITTAIDALGHTAGFEYDGNGRLVKYHHPDGAEKSVIFDCCYALLTTDERGLSRGYERDANGNIVKEIDAAASTAELAYDSNNNLVSFQDRCGRATFYHYDAARRLTRIVNALGQKQEFDYDPAGNLTALAVAGEEKMRFQYDPCHRLIATTDPLGFTISLERDALGREVMRQGARGQRVAFSYDPDGLLEKVFHDGEEVSRYRYNSGGQMVEARDESGTIAFAYDAEGHVKQVAYPGGWVLSCTSNAGGLVETITYPGGLTVHYTYDNRLRPAEISWPEGWIRYAYDAAGNLVREKRSNGTESSYHYDENERMIALEHSRGEEPFIARHNKLDAAGAIVETEGFQPLEPPADPDFAFSCNAADQIAASSFRYDADGNLISTPGWTAAYDAENRLVELAKDGTTRRYNYNSLGHRFQTIIEGKAHHHYHDPLGNLIFETAEEGKAPRCYLYCHCRPVAVVDGERGSRFYHYDPNGNTLALTGGDGTIAVAYAYSPLGQCLAGGDREGNPFTFGGAYGTISEGEGFYFMKRRFYSAAWGRFLQGDPLGFEGGINSYVYAANNPVTYIDPAGTLVAEAWLAWKAVGVVVGVVTVTYAAAKTAYSAYNTAKEYKRRTEAAEKAKQVFKEYTDICNARGTSLQEKEVAYKRYEEAYKVLVKHHNGILGSAEDTVTNAVDTGINYVTPDCLSVPAALTNTSVGDRAPMDPCTGGGGNYFVPRMPRLPSHYLVNE